AGHGQPPGRGVIRRVVEGNAPAARGRHAHDGSANAAGAASDDENGVRCAHPRSMARPRFRCQRVGPGLRECLSTSWIRAMSGSNQRIDGKRLWDSLMSMAELGATPKGGVRRITLTEVDKAG